MNIYVGNLSFQSSEDDIRAAFAAYGQVSSVSIIKDKFSGTSRGFGFVEMPNANEGRAAIDALNGKDLNGRSLTVNEARPRENSFSGGGQGRGGFGGPGRRSGPGGDRGDRGGQRGGPKRSW